MKPSRASAYRREKYAEDTAKMFSVVFNVREVAEFIDALAEDLAQAVRPAAQAGAQVLYERVQLNANLLGRKTGNLAKSIYQVYSNRISAPGKSAYYHISWNGSKAPHGHLVEYGYMKTHVSVINKRTGNWVTLKDQRLSSPRAVPPRPFVRNAISRLPFALDEATAEFYRRLKQFK